MSNLGNNTTTNSDRTVRSGTNLRHRRPGLRSNLKSGIVREGRSSEDGMIMVDTLTPQQRSERMSRVKGKDTKPEILVRKLAHSMGYRFRLHRKDLPGSPDLVFPVRRKVIFVHGCFWHGHENCRRGQRPKTRTKFWKEKIETNRRRDSRVRAELENLGWAILVVWECQLTSLEELTAKLRTFLDMQD